MFLSCFNKQSAPRCRASSRLAFSPRLESLENRLVPASSVSFVNGVLTVRGDSFADDQLVIRHDGDGGVTVTDSNGLHASRTGVGMVRVYTDGGNDKVRYTLTGDLQRGMPVHVFLGGGDDRFIGTVNRDLVSGKLDFYVHGESGADRLILYGTPIAPNRSGDGLTDGLAINTGGLTVGPGAELDAQLWSGDDNDSIFLEYQGELDGDLNFNLVGGNGDDTISAIIHLDSFSSGALGADSSEHFGDFEAATVNGGYGSDVLSFHVFGFSNGNVLLGALRMAGGTNPWWMPFENDIGFGTENILASGLETNFVS